MLYNGIFGCHGNICYVTTMHLFARCIVSMTSGAKVMAQTVVFGRVACNQLDHCIDVSVRPSVCPSVHPSTAATLCGPDLINCLPFTLDNDLYRQLRCRRCASNLLY